MSQSGCGIATAKGAKVAKGVAGPVLFLGVDPGIRSNGLAWCAMDSWEAPVAGRSVTRSVYDTLIPRGINCASFGDLVELGRFLVMDQLVDAYSATHTVVAVVECPTWTGHGTREVRSAALQWIDELKRRFARGRALRVDPKKWQWMLLAGSPGKTTKDQSVFRAQKVLRTNVSSDHEADAVCLCEFAGLWLGGRVSGAGNRWGYRERREGREKG